jgi:hypothetical protein
MTKEHAQTGIVAALGSAALFGMTGQPCEAEAWGKP